METDCVDASSSGLSPPGALEFIGQTHTRMHQTDVRPRGTLSVAPPRELLVARSIPGAYNSDGTLAKDTVRLQGQREWSPDDVPSRLPQAHRVVHSCDEDVVWGGYLTHHYGHFLTESVARLWVLLRGGPLEGLRVVFTSHRAWQRPAAYIHEWQRGFGLKMVELPESGVVRFSRMHVPEPAWRLNGWIAPEMRQIHMQARSGLNVPRSPTQTRALWLSRQGLARTRKPYDEKMLEWLVDGRIEVIRPETLTLAEQVGRIEDSTSIAGVMGSAFHTLLLARDVPKCVYLCASRFQSAFVAQDLLLDGQGIFVHALARTRMMTQGEPKIPGAYRILIPESLRVLSATIVPGLKDEPRLRVFSDPERMYASPQPWTKPDDIEGAVNKVLIDPLSAKARMRLAAILKAEGIRECALEQYLMVSDLAGEENATAPKMAVRLLRYLGRRREARAMEARDELP